VYRPHWFINDFDGLAVSSVHGSPWRYDSHVPIVFAGFGMQPARPSRTVHTVDVASTLASVVGSSLPASAVGEPLTEVAARRR
jgi:arylsulfatase A-like enzyme